ncbi:MAG: hypothetical protein M3Y27_16775 [Acidobacteriota bacterium]|nr:hypothetical protein [Acidobacteriota bacterium]
MDIIHDTPVTQQVNTYRLEQRARLHGGGLLFDQFFNVPISYPTVHNAITQAQSVLTGAGATSLTGPTLVSNVQSLVSSTSVIVQNSRQFSQHFTGTAEFIGPQTLMLGDGASYQCSLTRCRNYTLTPPPTVLTVIGQYATFSDCSPPPGQPCCGLTPFFVQAGTINFTTSDLGLFDVFQTTTTTTNTLLFTQVYEIVGISPLFITDTFQVRYASNLAIGDSFINLTNTGTSSTASFPVQDGNLCVNVYAFSPDEQLIACCACPVTPNGLASLSARNDLVSNTLTPGLPTAIVVKLLATAGTTAASCNAAAVRTRTNLPAPGLAAWGTALHALPVTPGTPAAIWADRDSLHAGHVERGGIDSYYDAVRVHSSER